MQERTQKFRAENGQFFNGGVLTIVLSVAAVMGLVSLSGVATSFRLPGDHQGYEPVQPIAFSHRLHAGELEAPCQYCHFGAERSRYAGIPPANVCMNCHRFVTASRSAIRGEEQLAEKENREPRAVESPELRKLYDALGLGKELSAPEPGKQPRPIQWVRVHKLPDFVHFDHRPHVAAGLACQKCHGPVETMERVRQVENLSMGWCVNCHRGRTDSAVARSGLKPSTDCSVCHM